MKSILIIGSKDGGKSTTIKEICKNLNPTKVYELDFNEKKLKDANINDIFNNTFIIEVKGKYILVIAGAPTEQNITLKTIIEITIEINISIAFLIVAKRTSERKENFDTIRDINDYSNLVHTEELKQIPIVDMSDSDSFKQNQEWISRIDRLVKIIIENI